MQYWVKYILIFLIFLYGCAPYAKINQLQPKMTLQEVTGFLGIPSEIHSETISTEWHGVITVKICEYNYFDSVYYMIFVNDKLFVWGTDKSITNTLNQMLFAQSAPMPGLLPEGKSPSDNRTVQPPSLYKYGEGSVTVPSYNWDSFYLLEGTIIVADDGQYLGTITTNNFDSDSLTNEFGKYGSEFASLSPFNKFTSTPPKIYDKHGNLIAYFTVNKLKVPRVDPVLLVAWLKSGR